MIVVRPLRRLRLLRLSCVFMSRRRAPPAADLGRAFGAPWTCRHEDAEDAKTQTLSEGVRRSVSFAAQRFRVRVDAGVRGSVLAASSASSRSSCCAARGSRAPRSLCVRDRPLAGCSTRSASACRAPEDARQDAEDEAGGSGVPVRSHLLGFVSRLLAYPGAHALDDAFSGGAMGVGDYDRARRALVKLDVEAASA